MEDHLTTSRGALESEQGHLQAPAPNFNSFQYFHILKGSTTVTEDKEEFFFFLNRLGKKMNANCNKDMAEKLA